MGQFGEALRSERISRGIALETISEKTKVITRYLSALEDEHFEALPGGILSKGIVRGYARTLGLNEAIWVERFMSASLEHGLSAGEADWLEFVQNVSRARPQLARPEHMRLRWAGVAVLLMLVTGLGVFVWHYVSEHAATQDLHQHPMASAAVAAPGQ